MRVRNVRCSCLGDEASRLPPSELPSSLGSRSVHLATRDRKIRMRTRATGWVAPHGSVSSPTLCCRCLRSKLVQLLRSRLLGCYTRGIPYDRQIPEILHTRAHTGRTHPGQKRTSHNHTRIKVRVARAIYSGLQYATLRAIYTVITLHVTKHSPGPRGHLCHYASSLT